MRHRVAGWKLGRNTSHRRALLRNLVTSLIIEERIETTVTKAKFMKAHVEKMITLGKKGGVANRRLAASFLMTPEAVDKLFNTVGPRFGDRNGGYTASSSPASARETAAPRRSSKFSAARRWWTRSARSAPNSAPSAPKRRARPWKRSRALQPRAAKSHRPSSVHISSGCLSGEELGRRTQASMRAFGRAFLLVNMRRSRY